MKVLRKDEIQAQIARQRKQEIDDSIATEKKADQARRDLSSLQNQHQIFIAGMKISMEHELEPLRREKNDLVFDIENAKKERAKLRVPLDEEWEKLNKEKIDLSQLKQLLDKQSLSVFDTTSQLRFERATLDADKRELENIRIGTLDDANKAEENKDESERILSTSKTTAEKRTSELDKRELKITQWDEDVKTKGIALDVRDKSLNARERALNERERFINDKYATLERTLNRLKK